MGIIEEYTRNGFCRIPREDSPITPEQVEQYLEFAKTLDFNTRNYGNFRYCTHGASRNFEAYYLPEIETIYPEIFSYNRLKHVSVHWLMRGDLLSNHKDGKPTLVLQLNDEYEGGKQIVPPEPPYKPRQGDITLLDSDRYHSVSEITAGNRYCLVYSYQK